MTTLATASVKGGLFPENGVNTLSSVSGKGSRRRQIAQGFGTKGLLAVRELADELNGVAPGAAALKTYSRVQAAEELGGARPIETVDLVNRVTAAGDVTEIDADFHTLTSRTTFGASPPPNLDGNPLGTR